MIEDLDKIELADLIISTSTFLLTKNADIAEVPYEIIERLCDLADYELVIRSESPIH
tara:strand:+ start:3723 stop:3893 length:171 start_codon:yes stop_codon:yes gene_type:complete